MTVVQLAGTGEAADLAAYLSRLLRWERAAVRLRAGDGVFAVFGRPPMDVVAVRTIRLAKPYDLDVTVSAGDCWRGSRDGPKSRLAH